MSGHSKWSSIKHKKGARDAKRGKLFTKLIKEITIAARLGGGDINANPRLRTAVLTARQQSMPNDNIDRAIKKGTGELGGGQLEQIVYEGYGAGGVAVIIDVFTDNRNRTVAELRYMLSRHGGNLGESGSVAWMFKKRGVISVEKDAADEGIFLESHVDCHSYFFTIQPLKLKKYVGRVILLGRSQSESSPRRQGYTTHYAAVVRIARRGRGDSLR